MLPPNCLNRPVQAALLAACLLVPSAIASAQEGMLLSESFTYDVGDLAAMDGGEGFASPWLVTVSDGATGTATVSEGSIAFSDFPVSGNRLSLELTEQDDFDQVDASRDVGVSATSGDLWVSYLYQRKDGGAARRSRAASLSFSDGSVKLSTDAKYTGGDGVAVRYDGKFTGKAAKAESDDASLQDGDSYLIVSRFTDLGLKGGTGTSWVLSASAYDDIKDGGITEQELDESAMLQAVDTTNVVDVLAEGDKLSMMLATSATPFAFDVDEIRVGASAAAVLPAASD